MSTFTIDSDNNITAYAGPEQVTPNEGTGLTQFASPAALAKVAADWPLSRLVEIWNSIPGHRLVKKFQDRNKAVARVGSAIQPLAGHSETAARQSEPRTPAAKPAKQREPTEKDGLAKGAHRVQQARDAAADRPNSIDATYVRAVR